MRRSRNIPADPAASTREAWVTMTDLVVGALPSVEESNLRDELEKAWPMVRYLIGIEATTDQPCSLAAGRLVCDFFTLHGTEALTASPPGPPPGAGGEISWIFYLPVPAGAPFAISDVEALGSHFASGLAPDSGADSTAASSITIDPERLRQASR